MQRKVKIDALHDFHLIKTIHKALRCSNTKIKDYSNLNNKKTLNIN